MRSADTPRIPPRRRSISGARRFIVPARQVAMLAFRSAFCYPRFCIGSGAQTGHKNIPGAAPVESVEWKPYRVRDLATGERSRPAWRLMRTGTRAASCCIVLVLANMVLFFRIMVYEYGACLRRYGYLTAAWQASDGLRRCDETSGRSLCKKFLVLLPGYA